MMEYIYAGYYFVMLVILTYCMFRLHTDRKDKKRNTFRWVCGFAILILIVSIIMMFTETPIVWKICNSIFFVSTDWIMYALFLFCIQISNEAAQNSKFIRVLCKLMIPFLVLDTISMFANIWTEHAFSYIKAFTITGEEVISYQSHILHYAHLWLGMGIGAITFVLLVYQFFRGNQLNRINYFGALIILFFLFIGEIIYLLLVPALDITPINSAIMVLVFYIWTLWYTPKRLLLVTLFTVIEQMKEMLCVFDMNGDCIFCNGKVAKYLEEHGYSFENMEEMRKYITNHIKNKVLLEEGDKTEIISFSENEYRLLSIHGQKYYESNGLYLGIFYIFTDDTKEKERPEGELYRATHDALTGLYNMEYFERVVKKCLEDNPEEKYLMIYSDIKDFKLIKEIFGIERGNQLIIDIAEAIKRYSKKGWFFCRSENDHFALLIPEKEHSDSTLIELIRTAEQINGSNNYKVHVYVGIYRITDRSVPVPVMCDRAQRAIKTIKNTYRKIAYYDEKMLHTSIQEQEMVNDIERALAQDEFKVYLQPQTNEDGTIIGAEALVRWLHPEKGMLMPGQFIPVFEQNGLITRLDVYVWEKVTEILSSWKERGYSDYYISVNISPVDIFYMDVFNIFCANIESKGIEPKNLRLEITETAIAQNFTDYSSLIEDLKNNGFIVEMDDFGSGYSSLNMLKEINVDVLKLDMAFLRDAMNGDRARIIMESVIDMAKKLKLSMIVEGVETEEQAKWLCNMGCDRFQGFYFAKPMPIEEFERAYFS